MRGLVVAVALLAAAIPAAEARAATVTAADSGGGPAWTASTLTRGARECVVLSREQTVARELCAGLGRRIPFLYSVHEERPADQAGWRNVFVVMLSRSVVSARLAAPGGVVRYRRGRGPRVLLAVGDGAAARPFLVVRTRIGRRIVTSTSGTPPGAVANDPFGGPAFAAAVDRRCVKWRRVTAPPAGEEAAGGPHCASGGGRLTVVGVEAVAGRLVVVGIAGRGIRDVELRGPGAVNVAFERIGRSFIAVLPGRVDRSRLRLVLRRARGRPLERRLG